MRVRPVQTKPVQHKVWAFLPHTSQQIALESDASHILYHGTRGPGKTDCQLMRFAKNVGKGYGSYWRGVIFDKKYKNLDDLILKSKRIFRQAFPEARFLESKSDLKWVWPTGEELLFRQFLRPDDYWNYHGQEFPFIGWNELAKYPNSEPYDKMMSCNRSSWTQTKNSPRDENGNFIVPPMPLEVFSTTNPYGPGHNWVKARFIDPAPAGAIFTTKINVFHPGLQREVEIERRQQAIFGSYKENPYLDPLYIAELESITDPNIRSAWLEGNWDIVAGGAIDDVWRKDIHILPRFTVPDTWYIDRAMDWGSSHPCAIGWFAEANGEECEVHFDDGSTWTFCPPRGSLIQIGELYLTTTFGSNKGLRKSSTEVAQLVRDYEIKQMNLGWFPKQPNPGPADNQIRNVNDASSDTIEKKMADEGIAWTPSDKSPGTRKIGLQLVRDRLEAALKRPEDPALFFMENCRASIATLPTLPRDEDDLDDVDTEAEDHPYDMVRYRCLASNNRAPTNLKVRRPT